MQRFPAEISSGDITAFFTISPIDMVFVQKKRGDHNRLGYGLQLCILRYFGFSPNDIMAIPDQVIIYVSSQLGVEPSILRLYGERMQTQSDHLQEIEGYLGFRKAAPIDLSAITSWLMERALEHDKPSLLLQQVCEKFYQEKIVRPGITRLEKMAAQARSQAQEETYRRLLPLLTPERKTFLDNLLVSEETTQHTSIYCIIKNQTSNSTSAMIFCLEKLAFLREQKIDKLDISALTPNILKFLSKISKQSTNQELHLINEEKRYPILLAFINQ